MEEDPVGSAVLANAGIIEPEDVADAVVAGMREERLLILPHEEVAGFLALKGGDPERWLKGMRRLVREARTAAGWRSPRLSPLPPLAPRVAEPSRPPSAWLPAAA